MAVKKRVRKVRKRTLDRDAAERDAFRCEGIASRYEVGLHYERADRYWRAAAQLWNLLGRRDRAMRCMANTNVPAGVKRGLSYNEKGGSK
jgi:hypothetical protein